MFEGYSPQAVHVVMVALRKAEQRGTAALEIEDLFVGLIVEDQEGPEAVFDRPGRAASPAGPNPPRRFFPPDVASGLLARVEALCMRSQPLPRGSEMPMSQSLKRVLDEAGRLRDELQQRKIQPLHLLAAAMAEDSSKAVQVFREAGITSESVRKALQDKAAAERKPLITVGAAAPVPITTNSPLYSSRARNINYLARLKARMRGAATINIEDLLVALLIEDQGEFLDAISEVPGIGIDITQIDLRPHPPALASSLADDLLARVEALCSRSEPLPPQSAIPMSETVKRIFAVADLLRDALQRGEVEPLHLLAAALAEESNLAVQIFREAGITREKVLKAIRGQGYTA